jgi:hypothetical protein
MPGSASERQAARVKRYYRWLDGLDFFRGKRAEGEAAHPVHRALADPDGGPPSPMVIHRLMLEGITLPEGFRALDAGCGYGATMLDLAPRLGGDWTGLTLSAEQRSAAWRRSAPPGWPGAYGSSSPPTTRPSPGAST